MRHGILRQDSARQSHQYLRYRGGTPAPVVVEPVERLKRAQGVEHVLRLPQGAAGPERVERSQVRGQETWALAIPGRREVTVESWICRPLKTRGDEVVVDRFSRVSRRRLSCSRSWGKGVEKGRARAEAVVDRRPGDAGTPGHGPEAQRRALDELALGGLEYRPGGSVHRRLAVSQAVGSGHVII
jgi:hypothetical protein